MNRLVAVALLGASLTLFGFAMNAQAQSYTAPAGIPAQTAHASSGR